MRRTFAVSLMLLPIMILAGCSFMKTSLAIHKFEKQEICFPNVITIVEEGIVHDTTCSITRPAFIIHFGPEDCFDCRLAHISDYYPLFTLAEQHDFDVMLIFSPSEENVVNTMSSIIDRKFLLPIIIDTNNSFSRLNPDFPTDYRFNHFLVDKDRHPIFVGNPLISPKLHKQFIKKIKLYEKS